MALKQSGQHVKFRVDIGQLTLRIRSDWLLSNTVVVLRIPDRWVSVKEVLDLDQWIEPHTFSDVGSQIKYTNDGLCDSTVSNG